MKNETNGIGYYCDEFNNHNNCFLFNKDNRETHKQTKT